MPQVIAHLQEERLAQPLQPEEHHDIEYDVQKQLEFARSLAAAATVPVVCPSLIPPMCAACVPLLGRRIRPHSNNNPEHEVYVPNGSHWAAARRRGADVCVRVFGAATCSNPKASLQPVPLRDCCNT